MAGDQGTAAGRPALRLPVARTEGYLKVLASSVDAARLNDAWPDPARLISSLYAMMPAVHEELYETLEVHREVGLPAYAEFVRVETDWLGAGREIAALEKWKDASGEGIYDKLARKRRYYGRLEGLPPMFDEKMDVKFRKIDRKSERALFRILLDRASRHGYLERITVDLAQTSSLWGRGDLVLDSSDVVSCKDVLQGLVWRMSNLDPEFFFIRLASEKGLAVERITMGRVGPLAFQGIEPRGGEAQMAELAAGGYIFSASLVVVATDQAADASNDPFHDARTLSDEARAELENGRAKVAYKVLRDRKFVLHGVDRAALDLAMRSRGTNNIVYEISG